MSRNSAGARYLENKPFRCKFVNMFRPHFEKKTNFVEICAL